MIKARLGVLRRQFASQASSARPWTVPREARAAIIASSLITIGVFAVFPLLVNPAEAEEKPKVASSLVFPTRAELQNSPDDKRKAFQAGVKALRKALPEDCISQEEHDLLSHGTTEWSYHDPESLPGVVLYPRSIEDVQAIVKIAAKHCIPIIPYSGGTSLEGHFNSPNSATDTSSGSTVKDPKPGFAFTVDFAENMNQVVEIHERDLDVVVQPGISYDALNEILKEKKLLFPVDPGPGATLGGMVGTGASGTNAVRYGTMRENVLSLTVVLPNGEILKTRSRAKKSSAGMDLGRLFIGAEGTLGLVVEACVKVVPLLPFSVGVSTFPDIQSAADAVAEVVQAGTQIQCIELLDELMIKAVNAANPSSRQWPEQTALFIKWQGSDDEQIGHQIKATEKIVSRHKGTKLIFAKDEKEKADIWHSRKVALWSALQYLPGSRCITTDICVPLSALPQAVHDIQEDLKSSNLIAPIVGHAGDGNIHALILYRDEEEKARAKVCVKNMVVSAQAHGGTCTGEHGVGLGKKEYLEAELGLPTIQLMQQIKKMVDPQNICNPGKLYPNL